MLWYRFTVFNFQSRWLHPLHFHSKPCHIWPDVLIAFFCSFCNLIGAAKFVQQEQIRYSAAAWSVCASWMQTVWLLIFPFHCGYYLTNLTVNYLASTYFVHPFTEAHKNGLSYCLVVTLSLRATELFTVNQIVIVTCSFGFLYVTLYVMLASTTGSALGQIMMVYVFNKTEAIWLFVTSLTLNQQFTSSDESKNFDQPDSCNLVKNPHNFIHRGLLQWNLSIVATAKISHLFFITASPGSDCTNPV